MNKINFVFFSDSLCPNGINIYGIEGPFFNYITKIKKYSYTLNGETRDGYKNIIMVEPIGTVYGISKINKEDILKIKNLITKHNNKLLIVSLADPSNHHAFKECLRFLKKQDLITSENLKNTKNIIFIDSNVKYSDNIFGLDYFLEEGTWFKENFFNSLNSLGYVSEIIKENELDKFRTKKFISFNRNNDKIHRFYLLREYLTGNYQDSYFSFLMNITQHNDLLMGNNDDKDDDRSQILSEIKKYNEKLPIELDTYNITKKNQFASSNTFKKELFLDSCINLVTETSFIDNELFLSEKIFKPILSYQPFIVFGPFGYLCRLKSYGFKTFSNFWDESYDNIEDSKERLNALLDLVRSLNSLSIYEMNDLYNKTKDICIYNKNLFYSLKIDNLEKILNKIEYEW